MSTKRTLKSSLLLFNSSSLWMVIVECLGGLWNNVGQYFREWVVFCVRCFVIAGVQVGTLYKWNGRTEDDDTLSPFYLSSHDVPSLMAWILVWSSPLLHAHTFVGIFLKCLKSDAKRLGPQSSRCAAARWHNYLLLLRMAWDESMCTIPYILQSYSSPSSR